MGWVAIADDEGDGDRAPCMPKKLHEARGNALKPRTRTLQGLLQGPLCATQLCFDANLIRLASTIVGGDSCSFRGGLTWIASDGLG